MMADRQSWREQARCLGEDPQMWFPASPGATKVSRQAVALCRMCEVRIQCLDYALTTGQVYGIWGGLTEQEREQERLTRTGRGA